MKPIEIKLLAINVAKICITGNSSKYRHFNGSSWCIVGNTFGNSTVYSFLFIGHDRISYSSSSLRASRTIGAFANMLIRAVL